MTKRWGPGVGVIAIYRILIMSDYQKIQKDCVRISSDWPLQDVDKPLDVIGKKRNYEGWIEGKVLMNMGSMISKYPSLEEFEINIPVEVF